MIFVKILIYYKINFARFELNVFRHFQKIPLFQKERQVEQLHYTIGDHERTILKFREIVQNMQVRFFSIFSFHSSIFQIASK